MKVNYDVPQVEGAGVNSVFPRIEYFYKDKDALLPPKLGTNPQFGSYGRIDITVIWTYSITGGNKIYQAVFNPQEASYWLDFYRKDGNVTEAFFMPAPDQASTGTFTPPSAPLPVSPVSPAAWYVENKTAYEYTFGNSGNTF